MNVSVIIPLYNKAAYIARALDSVLAQTIGDFELIVVDDGSTDGSGDIVRKYSDPRIRLITQENVGVSGARNHGVAKSTAQWIAFLDADDEWRPSFLERTQAFILAHPDVDTVFANFHDIVGRGPWLKDCRDIYGVVDYFQFCVRHNGRGMCSSCILVRKSTLNAVGGFPLGVHSSEDTDTWIRLALFGKIGYIPEILATYHNDVLGSKIRNGILARPVFPQCCMTLRQFRKSNRLASQFAKSILRLENLFFLQYARDLIEYKSWGAALRVLYCECQIWHCPKFSFVKVQCRLLLTLITRYLPSQ